jgi:UDP-3-O-[3-hydroxymyristoyl] N-acetylglucosamine deacetylase
MYTVVNSIIESGIGLFSGDLISLSLSPSYEEGIWFQNKNNFRQKLSPENIFIDNHNTSIVFSDGSSIKLIEHLLSAIFAFGISDILITVNHDEIPLFDGSSSSYVYLLSQLKLKKKSSFTYATLKDTVIVKDGDFFVKATPSKSLSFDFSIDFPSSIIGKESYSFEFSKQKYIDEISLARTFGFIENFELAKSIYKGANLENTIIISNDQLLSTLRIERELVRHKILDAIGDLRCFPFPFLMHYSSFGGSHKLNNKLLLEIIKNNLFEINSISTKEEYSLSSSRTLIKSYA